MQALVMTATRSGLRDPHHAWQSLLGSVNILATCAIGFMTYLQVDGLQVFPQVARVLITVQHHLQTGRRLQEVELVVAGPEGVEAARLTDAQRRAHWRFAGRPARIHAAQLHVWHRHGGAMLRSREWQAEGRAEGVTNSGSIAAAKVFKEKNRPNIIFWSSLTVPAPCRTGFGRDHS